MDEGVMDSQRAAKFAQMSERDREIQASIWALLFLVSEVCLAFRALRDRLHAREVLEPEDEELINRAASELEAMQHAYHHVERGFREKYERVRYAMEHPQEVEEAVRQKFGEVQRPQDYASTAGRPDPDDPEYQKERLTVSG